MGQFDARNVPEIVFSFAFTLRGDRNLGADT
jgi:hypothetical protein